MLLPNTRLLVGYNLKLTNKALLPNSCDGWSQMPRLLAYYNLRWLLAGSMSLLVAGWFYALLDLPVSTNLQ